MSLGINLRVTGHSNQGGRKYMEDYFSVAYQASEIEKNDVEYAYFGIFDGHGGSEAAKFAKDHLLREIVNNKLFWSKYDSDVLRAIREGYISTHYAMWREQEKWPKTATGLPSTAGTTASIAFIFRKKIYIGHVGDSGIILGYQEEGEKCWKAKPLTQDHKPECNIEKARIINSGGKVVTKSGVPRVVWNRPRIGHKGPVRRSTPFDEIPFLAVARSLGDLWSYNSALNQFIVSPDPDVRVIKIDSKSFRCLIFGTDGLWNVVTPDQAVDMARDAEIVNERLIFMGDNNNEWTNPSKYLVEKALERWTVRRMRADNTSVITVFLDQPGQPKKNISGSNNNGIIDRCSNTTRYELKYEMEKEFNPEHIIYNRYNEINSNDVLSGCRTENRQDYFYDSYPASSSTSSIMDREHLINSPAHISSNSGVISGCYSINTLEYSPTAIHNGGSECNAMNGFTVVEQYNTNCDTNNYSYYENSANLDNSSSNYKYDNCDVSDVVNESFVVHNSTTIMTATENMATLESSNFNLTHQLDEATITTNDQDHINSLDPLAIDNPNSDVEIQSDGSNYSHSFAESYNSLLISSLENENSSSSSSNSSNNSSSNSSNCSKNNSSDSSGDEEFYDGHHHSYKSLNETGLAGHDLVFHHSPNSSNEEQQQQYQKACMLHEDGYSLTKLETRVEQRLRNNTDVVPSNSNNNFVYNNPQQPQENQTHQGNNSIETFQTFDELDTEINTYNQYNSISSSFSLKNNDKNNSKNLNKQENNVEHKNMTDSDSVTTLSISPCPGLNIKSNSFASVESSDDIHAKSVEEMETESCVNEEKNDLEILHTSGDIENIIEDDVEELSDIRNTEYLLEESIQINEISSSNIEINSPIPSPSSSSNFILEKLEIEPTNLSCIEAAKTTLEHTTLQQTNLTENSKFKSNNNINNKVNNSVSSRNNIKSDITELGGKTHFPPDKQNENENTQKQNTTLNYIRRSLRSSNNKNIAKNINNNDNNNNSSNNKHKNNSNNNSNNSNSSLSKDMKAKKNLNKNRSTTNSLTKSIVTKEFLKLVNNSTNSISNNNNILNKLRSRPNNNNNNNNNSSSHNSIAPQSSENLVSTQKITVWSKRSRRTIQNTLSNSSNNNSNNKLNQKLNKALCTNNTANKNIHNNNNNNNNSASSIISSSSNNSNPKITTNYRLQNNSNHKNQHDHNSTISSVIASVSSTTSSLSSKSTTNYISAKRSSTSRNSAWCPKKSVQTRNRVQKR